LGSPPMSSTRAGGVGDGSREGKMEKVTVHRYWAGKRPDWAGSDEDDDIEEQIARRAADKAKRGGLQGQAPDARLRRLSEQGRGDSAGRHRRVAAAEVVEGDESGGDDDNSDEDSDADVRGRAKARARARQRAAAVATDEGDGGEAGAAEEVMGAGGKVDSGR
jgi:hypothetical protein